jgi:hypothetical protein
LELVETSIATYECGILKFYHQCPVVFISIMISPLLFPPQLHSTISTKTWVLIHSPATNELHYIHLHHFYDQTSERKGS